ncbi:MAG TPA: aminotransferase class V-fold PLP-dependent enzyme [Pirellulales bacterium]|nr:aminotransferase class V-fold PLP-dependent enzyme [Pirellulales bacterium]
MHTPPDEDRFEMEGVPRGTTDWPPNDVEVSEALKRAFADGSWGRYHGPYVPRLAEALSEFFELTYAYPCCSGTFAVELALRALRIGSRDEVILAGYDYPGNFRAIEAIGARPVLVDIDPDNWNLDPKRLSTAIGPQTRAVLVSHLHGGLVPMSEVMEVARQHELAVVEDICQAPGAVVEDRLAGTWGDVTVLSFGGSKLLTSGRGGAILTRSAEAHQRAKIFCEQGNHAFPLSELQAAVLLPQLAKLHDRNRQRTGAVERLLAGLSGISCLNPLVNRAAGSTPAYYKVGFQYDAAMAGRTRGEFIAAAQAEGVAIDAGFRGFAHRSEKRCRIVGDLAECRRAGESALILHHPVLLEPSGTIDCVAAALRRVAGC